MRFYPIKGGGGAGVSSEDVTVTKYDVPKSKTALTFDSEDEIVSGLLDEYNGGVIEASNSLDSDNSRVQLAIPNRGLYSTGVKLFTTFANLRSLLGLTADMIAYNKSILGLEGSFTSDATVAANNMLSGVIGYGKGTRYVGNIASQGALTLNPGTTAKTGSVAGKYMTGNITVPAVSVPASVVKKNHTLWFPDGSSVTGQFEGWVPTATDLYLRGQNIGLDASKSTGWQFRSGELYARYDSYLYLSNEVDLSRYNYFNIEMRYENANFGAGASVWLATKATQYIEQGVASVGCGQHLNTQTVSINVSMVNQSAAWVICWGLREGSIYIYRIWLS